MQARWIESRWWCTLHAIRVGNWPSTNAGICSPATMTLDQDRERWVQVMEGADSGWRVGYQHAPLGNAGPWNMGTSLGAAL